MSNSTDHYRTHEEIRRDLSRAINAGAMSEASSLAAKLVDSAERVGDQVLLDRALCNLAVVEIEQGETSSAKRQLTQVLLRSSDQANAYLAAYTLSRAYQVDEDRSKSLRYVTIARRHAEDLGCLERQANCHNQEGYLLLSESEFESAVGHFELALTLLPDTPSTARAALLDNLGYTRVVLGDSRAGFRALFAALRMVHRIGASAWEACQRNSLCFAYLSVDRSDRAIQHGRKALEIGEKYGDRSAVKHALFLLGEAEKRNGNLLLARRLFGRLQADYYPDSPAVSDLLLILNVSNVVNIKG